jgi:hypothetical protein
MSSSDEIARLARNLATLASHRLKDAEVPSLPDALVGYLNAMFEALGDGDREEVHRLAQLALWKNEQQWEDG